MRKITLMLAIIQFILIPSIAIAQHKPIKIAVLPFQAHNVSAVYALGAGHIVQRTLAQQKNIIIIKQDNSHCKDRDCLAAIGAQNQVAAVITGAITGQGQKTMIALQSFQVATGAFNYETTITFEPASNIDQAVNRLVEKYIHDVYMRLAAPKNVQASIARETITVTWQKGKQAQKYAVYRADSKDGRYQKVIITDQQLYQDTAVTRGNKYYYKVQSLDDKGFSDYSASAYGIRAYATSGFYLRGIVPGWGQLYYGHRLKGSLFLSAFALSCVSTGILYNNYRNKQSAYDNYNPSPLYPGDVSYQAEFNKRYNASNQAYHLFLFSTLVTGIIYAANWVDMLWFTDPVYDRPSEQASQSTYFNINSFVASKERRTEISIGMKF